MGDALKNPRAVIAVHTQQTALRKIQCHHRSLLQGLGFGLLNDIEAGAAD